jgi:hypothetical protein
VAVQVCGRTFWAVLIFCVLKSAGLKRKRFDGSCG